MLIKAILGSLSGRNRFRTRAGTPCPELEVTRCHNAQRITRRGFGELPNRQHVPERWNVDSSTSPMNLLSKETVLLFDAETSRLQSNS